MARAGKSLRFDISRVWLLYSPVMAWVCVGVCEVGLCWGIFNIDGQEERKREREREEGRGGEGKEKLQKTRKRWVAPLH